jgi:hypothetical protein
MISMPQNNNGEELVFVDRDEENGGCTRTIEKKVSVAAQVQIKPSVHVTESDVEIECCGPAVVKRLRKRKKHGKKKSPREKQPKADKCKFIVQQDLCVHVPIQFDAEAEARPLGIVCESGSECQGHANKDKNI